MGPDGAGWIARLRTWTSGSTADHSPPSTLRNRPVGVPARTCDGVAGSTATTLMDAPSGPAGVQVPTPPPALRVIARTRRPSHIELTVRRPRRDATPARRRPDGTLPGARCLERSCQRSTVVL